MHSELPLDPACLNRVSQPRIPAGDFWPGQMPLRMGTELIRMAPPGVNKALMKLARQPSRLLQVGRKWASAHLRQCYRIPGFRNSQLETVISPGNY